MNESFEHKSGEFLANLTEGVRRNPIATALIGMGVLWLFTGGKTASTASNLVQRSGLDRLPEKAAEGFAAGREVVREGVDALNERVAGVADSASALAHSAKQSALDFGQGIPTASADAFTVARTRLEGLFDQQPLMLGAVGVAIGAGIAASLPITEIETEWASELANEQTERLRSLAGDVADRATEEARRQGLTPDGLKAAASQVADKVKRVAEAAGENLRAGAE